MNEEIKRKLIKLLVNPDGWILEYGTELHHESGVKIDLDALYFPFLAWAKLKYPIEYTFTFIEYFSLRRYFKGLYKLLKRQNQIREQEQLKEKLNEMFI